MKRILGLIIGVFLVSYLVNSFFFFQSDVNGVSMQPTLTSGDKIIINRLSKIQRNDLIMFTSPKNKNDHLIKRVVGMPGDTVRFDHYQLYIDNVKIDEPYLTKINKTPRKNDSTKSYTDFNITKDNKIPKNKYLVLGDNRRFSNDSRYFGLIEDKDILGKATLKVYPFSKTNFFID